jgi:hypothetical protein
MAATTFRGRASRLGESPWLFPIICIATLFLLTAFHISGSSVGIYHTYFYGDGSKDNNLLINRPRAVRSDEWLANTQMTIAQANNDYRQVNPNIGTGEDMSIILDVPYKDWSAIFKPQNLVFFVLPLEYAFAFKWWLMACLLLLSSYSFVLILLPKRRLFAALFALALLFSPFVQWWYQYITLAPISYTLFSLSVFILILRARQFGIRLWLGILMSYLMACFILVLYPPFQIPCVLVAGVFVVGYVTQESSTKGFESSLKALYQLGGAAAVAILVAALFFITRLPAVSAVRQTVYPGHRTVLNGGFSLTHLLSANLSYGLQWGRKFAAYNLPQYGLSNQSEASNFILLIPFLILPGLWLVVRKYQAEKIIDWPLTVTSALFALFMARLFLPHFNWVSRLLLLDRVPHARLLIGLGLLSAIHTVLVAKHLASQKQLIISNNFAYLCALLTLAVELTLGLQMHGRAPGDISVLLAIALALPVPLIVLLLLRRQLAWAAFVSLGFSLISAGGVHPLYGGLGVLTESPLSNAIKTLSKSDEGRWVAEGLMLENYASLNGAPSLSGVYAYPQLNVWSDIVGAKQDVYNRYAHAVFELDRNPHETARTSLNLDGQDSFSVSVDPCSDFLQRQNVRFVITDTEFDNQQQCLTLADTIAYPARTIYIYRLHHL